MRLRLEDQGDRWFWADPAIEVDVIEETWGHSRAYYKIRLQPPVERQESGASSPSGLLLVVYRVAWLSSRWVGHQIRSELDTSTFLWLVRGEGESVPPPGDSPPSAWVLCRKMS